MNLDDSTRFSELDPGGMLERVGELPQQCRAAWALAQALELPPPYGAFRHVVILGMGGSAIGGALLQGLVAGECSVPVTIVRGYTLPAFVRGPDTLAIACSHSGNTEETLSALGDALEKGTRPVVITTGGKAAALAEERGVPLVRYDYQSQPRAALGYSFTLLLGLFCRLGLVRDHSVDLDEAVQVMEAWQAEIEPAIPAARNAAKSLTGRLCDRLPVVYGAGFLAAVANRWKTQFNENGKPWHPSGHARAGARPDAALKPGSSARAGALGRDAGTARARGCGERDAAGAGRKQAGARALADPLWRLCECLPGDAQRRGPDAGGDDRFP
jgi:glucose/mannose-6-phosphate isomerase